MFKISGFKTVCLLLLSLGKAWSQADDVRAVYVQNKDLYIVPQNGETRQLTHDALAKGDPVWSPDGTKIAYRVPIDKDIALAHVIIVDSQTGSRTSDYYIRPATSDTVEINRYIKAIQWLSESRIAAFGSVNPSTEDVVVVDAYTGKEVDDFTDDGGGGTVFSQDGLHAASIQGAPHWTPEEERMPSLTIDQQSGIYPPKDVRVDFLSTPNWSPDKTHVSIVAQSKSGLIGEAQTVVCDLSANCSIISFKLASKDETFKLEWKADALVIRSTLGRVLSVATNEEGRPKRVVAVKPNLAPLSASQQATLLTAPLRAKIEALGGKAPDFWCSSCVLTRLPIRARRYDQ